MRDFKQIFTDEKLKELFPASRADDFFEALFGDASEGAYDISVKFAGEDSNENALRFELHLAERPGKCLACNLTYGLPEVFSRHPIININGFVSEIDKILGEETNTKGWKLQTTQSVSNNLHVVPLMINLD